MFGKGDADKVQALLNQSAGSGLWARHRTEMTGSLMRVCVFVCVCVSMSKWLGSVHVHVY